MKKEKEKIPIQLIIVGESCVGKTSLLYKYTKNYFHNADGIIIVYDVSLKSSFDKVQEWVNSIYEYSEKNIQKVLVGNKIDLEREVSKEEGEKIAESFEIPFFETSAKEDDVIKDVMKKIIQDILNNKDLSKRGEKLSMDKNNNNNDNNSRCGC